MHPLIWSVLLLAFGLGLAMLEVFIPSAGILGFLSLSAIVTAIVLAFSFGGTTAGFLFLGWRVLYGDIVKSRLENLTLKLEKTYKRFISLLIARIKAYGLKWYRWYSKIGNTTNISIPE